MINREYLPSKNFLISLSVALAIVLIAIIFSYSKSGVTNYFNNNLKTDTNDISAIANINIDSDNDGLADWKENLYGTSAQRADSDEDGTSDTDEISQNRDPLKANTAPSSQAPNDKIDPALVEETQRTIEQYENLTATEKMSRNLMADIFANQQIGSEMDQETIDSIVQKSINNMSVKEFTSITKVSDLNLIEINMETFGNDLAVYLKKYYDETGLYKTIAGKDLEIINSYISDSDETEVKKNMAQITSKYQNIINNLIKAPLPSLPDSSGTITHLAIINSLEKLIKIDNDIINTSISDIATIFSDISVYNSTTKELLLALQVMDSMLKINR